MKRNQNADILLPQLHHHIRDLNIFLRLVFRCYLVDYVFLIIRNWLLTDVLDQLAQSIQNK